MAYLVRKTTFCLANIKFSPAPTPAGLTAAQAQEILFASTAAILTL